MIFHQGACSDTMETDGRYMMENNYATRSIFSIGRRSTAFPSSTQVRLLPTVRPRCLSKMLPTKDRLTFTATRSTCLIRSYAQHELAHRTRCRHALLQRIRSARTAQGPYGFRRPSTNTSNLKRKVESNSLKDASVTANGCQMRDFVFVEDVIDIAMYFMTAGKSGIFNCGSGRAQPFNDVALTVVNRFPALTTRSKKPFPRD